MVTRISRLLTKVFSPYKMTRLEENRLEVLIRKVEEAPPKVTDPKMEEALRILKAVERKNYEITLELCSIQYRGLPGVTMPVTYTKLEQVRKRVDFLIKDSVLKQSTIDRIKFADTIDSMEEQLRLKKQKELDEEETERQAFEWLQETKKSLDI